MTLHSAPSAGMARRPLSLAFSAIPLAFALAGCGGGGGGDEATPPAAVVVSGVAATGAAFTGATVTVVDARGVTVGTSAVVGATGAFSITLAAGAQGPFVITASRTAADGGVDSLFSVLATATTATVNITPVTTLVSSRLSTSGNPLALAAEVKAVPGTIDDAKVAAKVAEVQEILAPVLTATGTAATHPISGTFAVDGSGYDRLLDAITVNIIPASTTATHVEVGIRRTTTEGEQPPVIQFSSTATVGQIKNDNKAVINAAIPSAELIPAGTNALIQQLLARVTACHALPVTSRINPGGTAASDIKATECKSVFVNNDPTAFLSNGERVSATGAFASLYRNEATGVVFDQGAYLFTRTNGDFIVRYHTRGVQGAETNGTLALRQEGDVLKISSNGYAYPGAIIPYQQHRQFVTKDQTAYNYRSTGYVADIRNVTVDGAPIFDRVEVVAPDGAMVELRPSVSSEFLVLQRAAGASASSFIRLRSVFDNAATPGIPSSIDARNLFFVQTDRTDAQIAAIPAQSSWTFRYYLASAPGSLAATQYYKTTARALTIPEFQAQPLARLTDAAVATLKATANANGVIPLAGGPYGGLLWEVPAGAVAPTQLSAFGVLGAERTPFNDERQVTTLSRSGSVLCTLASSVDVHCDGTSGDYAPLAFGTALHLKARDSSGRDLVNYYATYTVPVVN